MRLVLAGALELGGVGLGMPDVTPGLPQALNATKDRRTVRRRTYRFGASSASGDRELTTTLWLLGHIFATVSAVDRYAGDGLRDLRPIATQASRSGSNSVGRRVRFGTRRPRVESRPPTTTFLVGQNAWLYR